MRINKFIASTGFCSRRKADEIIKHGRGRVNGQALTDLSYQVNDGDKVEIDGLKIQAQSEKVYYLFNKPYAVLSSHSDPHHDHFVYDYFPRDLQLFSAGRLDYDSEGLMIITNDGDFANHIAHPSYEIEKEYIALLDKPIQQQTLDKIKMGVSYQGADYHVNNVGFLDPGVWPNLTSLLEDWQPETYDKYSLVTVSLHEGQKREVRRIFESQGFQVRRLIRVRIGDVRLDTKVGDYRLLNQEEITGLDEATR